MHKLILHERAKSEISNGDLFSNFKKERDKVKEMTTHTSSPLTLRGYLYQCQNYLHTVETENKLTGCYLPTSLLHNYTLKNRSTHRTQQWIRKWVSVSSLLAVKVRKVGWFDSIGPGECYRKTHASWWELPILPTTAFKMQSQRHWMNGRHCLIVRAFPSSGPGRPRSSVELLVVLLFGA